jgi:heme oxygenase (mycobilin-producing)
MVPDLRGQATQRHLDSVRYRIGQQRNARAHARADIRSFFQTVQSGHFPVIGRSWPRDKTPLTRRGDVSRDNALMSVVKINVLTVPESMRDELERRFAGRAGLVENADGFEGFELLRPVDGNDRYFVYTRWRSEEDFQRWTESQSFQKGHEQARADAEKAGAAPGGAGTGHGHGGPASSAAELWSFEIIEQAAPKE